MKTKSFGIGVAFSVVAIACAAGTASPDGVSARNGWFTPPPRPGSSITHTKLCECTTCNPERCCRGETEASSESTCTNSYDFSAPECGLSVETCTSRCSKHVWRVQLKDDCAPLPSQCCEATSH